MQLEYFFMIDQVTGRTPDSITATATVPQASPVFEGHFPGHPLVPGVLLIETMAQAAGWMLLARMEFARMPFLAAVREAKLRRFVPPGTPLTATATLTHDGSGYAVCATALLAPAGRVADAELTLRIMDFPSPELADAMRATAARIGLTPAPTPA